MTPAERGSLGGTATFRKYGRAHMAALGRLGFSAASKKLGSRTALLARLAAKGRIKLPGPAPDQLDRIVAECAAIIDDGTGYGEIPF